MPSLIWRPNTSGDAILFHSCWGRSAFLAFTRETENKKAACAAHAAGIPFCLSTFSIASLADLRQATDGVLHFQLYVLDDRALCEGVSKRCGRGRCRGAVRDRRYGHHRHPRT
ncbi:alpha-hydroxy-acid oxidizing protein (plasmid) [Rhizobium leguminosarum]|nr:alpha-hydroxy-acid oxidizing protein [Rhizobium leguminosarum]